MAGSPPPATAAIRHPATRAAFRQRQSGPHRLVGGSLVLLTVWAIVVGWSQAPSDRLAATGLDTSGEVVEVRGPPRISLFDSGSVVVAYQVEQEPAPRRAVVRLNDLSPAYQAGDHVQVLYDPDAPARATIAGEGNEQPLLVALGILTFVFGGMGLPIGLVLWLGGRMLHHELAHDRWQTHRYRHASVPVDDTGDGTQTIEVPVVDARVVDAGGPLLWEVSGIGEAGDDAWQPAAPGGRGPARGRCHVALPRAASVW